MSERLGKIGLLFGAAIALTAVQKKRAAARTENPGVQGQSLDTLVAHGLQRVQNAAKREFVGLEADLGIDGSDPDEDDDYDDEYEHDDDDDVYAPRCATGPIFDV